MPDNACHGKVSPRYNNQKQRIKLKLTPFIKKNYQPGNLPWISSTGLRQLSVHIVCCIENDRIIVAVSGGADSMALLHILADITLPLELIAVYIDHGLRPEETPHEQEIIAHSCESLNIIFKVRAVNVQKIIAENKKSPEEAARILRYRALEKIRQQYDAQVIAVGHTADDQVEEFFIRLIRGSSSRGLSGMRVKRDYIVRPLLV